MAKDFDRRLGAGDFLRRSRRSYRAVSQPDCRAFGNDDWDAIHRRERLDHQEGGLRHDTLDVPVDGAIHRSPAEEPPFQESKTRSAADGIADRVTRRATIKEIPPNYVYLLAPAYAMLSGKIQLAGKDLRTVTISPTTLRIDP